MFLKFIGTGSAFNDVLGNTSAYVKSEHTFVLFDCGGTVFHGIQQLKLLEGIKNVYVVITHTHPDHVGSLGDFIFYCHYMLNIKVKVIFPHNDAITELLNILGVKEEFYQLQIIDKKLEIKEGNIEVSLEAIKQIHSSNLDCYGYIVKFNNKTIFYSGDASTIKNEVLERFNNGEINSIYQDTCGKDFPENPHLFMDKLANYIKLEKRKQVFCMHLDKSFDVKKAKKLGFSVVESEKALDYLELL